MKKTPRGYRFILVLIWLTLVGALLVSIFEARWSTTFVTGITFVLTLVPFFISRKTRFYIPHGFMVATVSFIYATLFLGEVGDFYERFWWWDVVLHTGSGFAFGMIGFIILLLLYRGERVQANPFLLSVFAFCFAIAIGAVWEIIEFILDQTLGWNMQKTGLVDTMWDLIIDTLGASFAAVSGYLYMTDKWKSWFGKMIIDSAKDIEKVT